MFFFMIVRILEPAKWSGPICCYQPSPENLIVTIKKFIYIVFMSNVVINVYIMNKFSHGFRLNFE